MGEITVGCWVHTPFGIAVCTSVSDVFHGILPEGSTPGDHPEPSMFRRTCQFRYPAFRPGDSKKIWVANGGAIAKEESDPGWLIRFAAPKNEESVRVLALKGPYGEGFDGEEA